MATVGLELLWALEAAEISQPQDALVCFIHWELINHGFRCLGTGEKAGAQETGSERLPSGWASNKELYTLRYGTSKPKILLKAVPADGFLIVNTMDLPREVVFDVTINIAESIDSANLKDCHRAYKNPTALKKQLETKLISRLRGPKGSSEKLEKEHGKPPKPDPLKDPLRDPLREPPRNPAFHHSRGGHSGGVPYGAADLDPLGGRGGGMIFEPFPPRPQPGPIPGLPPGAVPPDARFDPFGPPPISGRSGPDPDHLPPPGYDDMFM